MQYRLRTLLIALAVGPPIAAVAYQDWGLGLWPIYALVLAIIAVVVALALWFLHWARTEYELALKSDIAEPNP